MKHGKKRVITLVTVLVLIILVLVFVLKQTNSHYATILVHGEVTEKFLDSFVVKTQYTSDNQVFFVFRVEKDTEIIDADGNPIRFSDVLIGSKIQLAFSEADYPLEYFYSERHEILPAQIVLK